MSTLKYITKGNRLPLDRPKVFFYSHKNDAFLLGKISEQILQQVDCSVWYLESEGGLSDPLEEEVLEDISLMQLVVIPVSSSFLKINARKHELLSFFFQKGIPILPLLQEKDLDQAYSAVFGSIHYLSEFEENAYGLPYAERLGLYLTKILEYSVKEKVQKAFLGHAFISYRKKDRYYVKDFLQKLHTYPDLEDLAIWYDDFLVPGEDFHSEIKASIENCDVFLLVVTPNLTEKGNYVAEKEYPLAMRLGKKILAYEASPTESDLLYIRYDGLPLLMDISQTHEALVGYLGRGEVKETKSPLEKYYLGIAYFNGFDMEVDRPHGIRLIKEAADQGSEDALLTLSILPSVEEASTPLTYRKQLVEKLKKNYNQTKDPWEFRKFLAQSLILGSELKKAGLYRDSLSLFSECLHTIDHDGFLVSNQERLLTKLQINTNLGELYLALGKEGDFQKVFQETLDEAGKVDDNVKDYDILRYAFLAYERLGTYAFARKKYTLAMEYFAPLYSNAKKVYEECKEGNLPPIRSSNQLQEINYLVGGDPSFLSMNMQDQLMDLVFRDYAISCTKVGDCHLEMKQYREAQRKYQEAENVLSTLKKMAYTEIQIERELGVLHRKKADLYAFIGEPQLSVKEIKAAITIGEELAKDNPYELYKWDVAVYYYQLGSIYELLKERKEARHSYQQALDFCNNLSKTNATVSLEKMCKQSLRRCRSFFG